MSTGRQTQDRWDGLQRISIELTNICNLHCSYCLRDDEALYHRPANFFPVALLRRIIHEARDVADLKTVSFTGGEVTLHPQFGDILKAVEEENLSASFVTNGWHFERIHPTLLAHRKALSHVAFSLDGATREAHDRWRGSGSFVRLVRAFVRCRMSHMPYTVKVSIRRDTVPQFEQIAIFAARMGASALSFAHLLPTSTVIEEASGLSFEERKHAEQEIATLASICKMPIRIDVGYYNTNPGAPCLALAGVSCNVNYRGHLSLCCNMSGYRSAVSDTDVVADLNTEGFAGAYLRLREVASRQLQRRAQALEELAKRQDTADSTAALPCMYCLQSFEKIPWQRDHRGPLRERALPVLASR